MKYLPLLIFIMTMCFGLSELPRAFASGGDQHDHTEQQQGPEGGKLLTAGDFAVEISIFESGIAPEMRVYTYQNNRIVQPDKVRLQVTLHRLGNVTDTLTFSPEGNYLVSNETVAEPHSYKVSVKAQTGKQQGAWDYESVEGRTTLTDRVIRKAGITVDKAGPQTLNFTERLFGVVAPVNKRIAHVSATYAGIVTDVRVNIGEAVNKGQTLAVVKSAASGTEYDLVSPISGEVTQRLVNTGEMAAEQMLFEIIDLSKVWVELSAFPQNIDKLKVGQQAEIFDLHQHQRVKGQVTYIAPIMTGGHIARARVLVSNTHGHWRPGMHVQADVKVGQKAVPLAVKTDALKTFRNMPVVFARFGNTFEVRMPQLGDTDGNYTEVKSGLAPGTFYVSGNSYLLKADILKHGASHQH
ncbi:efflux RND transporter periplasmic adaptor subunit [Lacimicrobium alkaliphilum]|uniref:Cation efflux system protein n=1 Tax=Lacimicrobium alkaliphilum TaxID=1526571 RepID=A0ABQ1RC89_9ALTE|nr:efflux RND transporter periplasmic adaptor subunit [Lacimicrobium alkaliphilum]GGD65675.1 cation efflux system protein [Lacimicrobium alkaliphilum]